MVTVIIFKKILTSQNDRTSLERSSSGTCWCAGSVDEDGSGELEAIKFSIKEC